MAMELIALCREVAQIFNLLHRRIAIGRGEYGDAPKNLEAWQNANLRYSRLEICATLLRDA